MNSYEKFLQDGDYFHTPSLRAAYIAGLRRAVEMGKNEIAANAEDPAKDIVDPTWGAGWDSACRHYVEAIEAEASKVENAK